MPAIISKMVSGGQTGVDRAALDVAKALGIGCGGWCPRRRMAEDGIISSKYPLQETPSADYSQRTEWNVRDSDGTLVLTLGEPKSGTAFTIEVAARLAKPCLVLDLDDQPDIAPAHPRRQAHPLSHPPNPQARLDAPASHGLSLPRQTLCPGTRPLPSSPSHPRRAMTRPFPIAAVHHWIKAHDIRILNVAGPRESTCPGIYTRAKQFLLAVLVEDPSTTP
ncbi:MAG: putative molybdenum carrier protein [Nitrospiraceae bacterium]